MTLSSSFTRKDFLLEKRKLILVLISLISFLIANLLFSKISIAASIGLDCRKDFKGECKSASDCVDSGGETVNGYLSGPPTGEEINCPAGQICCVSSCEKAGGTCLPISGMEVTPCEKNIGIQDCDNNLGDISWGDEVCCTKTQSEDACEDAGGECLPDDPITGGPCDDHDLFTPLPQYNSACEEKYGQDYVCCKRNEDSGCILVGGTCVKKEDCEQEVADKTGTAACQEIHDKNYICCKEKKVEEGGGVTPRTFQYPNPLNVNSFTEWFNNLLAAIQGIVGWLAVIMIVVGGMVYLTSGGSSRQTTLGKTIITWALVGFAITVAAPSLLKEIYAIASANHSAAADLIDNANPVKKIVTNIMYFLFSGVGVLALISFVISGIMFLTAGGSERAENAKKAIFYSIIAIVISGGSLILLKQILTFLAAKQ